MSLIYRSLRVGENGKLFYLYKLRTMKTDGGVPTAGKNDPRLIWWGKWLRRFKLDEIPTLWNIIKRDINLVGPRPDTPEEIDSLSAEVRRIVLSRKPGIISPATLWDYQEDETLANKDDPHRYYTEMIKPTKYALNVWYVNNHSWKLDLKIIFAYVCRHFGIAPRKWGIYPAGFDERIGE